MPLSSPECLDNEKNGGRDRGYQMRYRSLEDSLVVAEQQSECVLAEDTDQQSECLGSGR